MRISEGEMLKIRRFLDRKSAIWCLDFMAGAPGSQAELLDFEGV
jgi:hypothetical protein